MATVLPKLPRLLPLLAALALPACKARKYALYESGTKDFYCEAPTGWPVRVDEQGTEYRNVVFTGPFDPDFYLGLPSLSVRWHAYGRGHVLPGGEVERYESVEDYERQMLERVYSRSVLEQEPHDVVVNGRVLRHFVVLSPVSVPSSRRWGVLLDKESGGKVNLRKHAYVLVPVKSGFYALVYPATRDGYGRYVDRYNVLLNTFRTVGDGPGR